MDFRAIIGDIVPKAVAIIWSIINEGKGAIASKRPSEGLILSNLADCPP